jgi:hypothetical protein
MTPSSPYVAQLAGGGQVVVWESGASGTTSIYAQVLDANRERVGNPIAVFGPGSTNGWQVGGVVGLPDGSFLVTGSGESVVSGAAEIRLYVQRVSATGELLASGGVSDAGVNGGLADRLLSSSQSDTLAFIAGPFFLNADGSYVLSVNRVGHPVPLSAQDRLLVSVDASGNVIGSPANLSQTNYAFYPVPVVARLGNGNFLVAGTSTITYGPVVWKIVTPTGEVVTEHSLGAAPGNGTSDAQVTSLADGTGLLTFHRTDSVGESWVGMRIDASGNVLGNASAPSASGQVTGLSGGGYVYTWISGSQLLAQYFNSSGQAAGDSFVVAGNLAVGLDFMGQTYTILPVAGGFVAVYQAASSSGRQVYEAMFTAPPLA